MTRTECAVVIAPPPWDSPCWHRRHGTRAGRPPCPCRAERSRVLWNFVSGLFTTWAEESGTMDPEVSPKPRIRGENRGR